MSTTQQPPRHLYIDDTLILGFAGYSGAGKTTLLKKLIPLLNAKNIRLALIKHAHHNFDIDQPGKDSYELRKAGIPQVLIASANRWALMTETPASNNGSNSHPDKKLTNEQDNDNDNDNDNGNEINIKPNSEQADDVSLTEMLSRLNYNTTDLVLVEGFKHENIIAKIEVHRKANNKDWLHPNDPNIIAIMSDIKPNKTTLTLPWFDINQVETLANYIQSLPLKPNVQ